MMYMELFVHNKIRSNKQKCNKYKYNNIKYINYILCRIC